VRRSRRCRLDSDESLRGAYLYYGAQLAIGKAQTGLNSPPADSAGSVQHEPATRGKLSAIVRGFSPRCSQRRQERQARSPTVSPADIRHNMPAVNLAHLRLAPTVLPAWLSSLDRANQA